MIANDVAARSLTAPAPAQTKSEKAGAKASEDFQTFLSLLTAQLQNQDPLAPTDSTQFVEQLASFSALEQQIETNAQLEKLVSSGDVSGLEGAAQWIGKEIDAPVSTVSFSGEPIELQIPSGPGSPVEFVIADASGAILRQAPLSPGQTLYTFEAGVEEPLPPGNYSVAIAYQSDDGEATSGAPVVSARIVEARRVDGVLRLVTDSGAIVDPETLTAIREPRQAQKEIPGSEVEAEEPASDLLAGDVQN